MKSELESYLRSNGVKDIINDRGTHIDLGRAKTADLIKAAEKLGRYE